MARHDEKARLARAILDNRAQRRTLLPEALFGEWGWEALLELFVADAVPERLTAREIARRIGCDERVMSRWLKFLSEQRLVVGDGDGDLDDLLTLSPTAIVAIERHLEATQFTGQQFVQSSRSEGPNRLGAG